MKRRREICLLETGETEKIHEAMLQSLQKAGAKVDFDSEQVSFPPKLVEEVIAGLKADVKAGRKFPPGYPQPQKPPGHLPWSYTCWRGIHQRRGLVAAEAPCRFFAEIVIDKAH